MIFRSARYTKVFNSDTEFSLAKGIYIYGSVEERSSHFNLTVYQHLNFKKVNEGEDGLTFNINDGQTNQKSMVNFRSVLEQLEDDYIYIDITGLTHSFWAPFIKALIEKQKKFSVVYVEPLEYTKTIDSEKHVIYDLSEKIRGIAPIPGFASFSVDEERFLFVPTLGFEGARYSFMIENVEPVGNNTYPIIGVPGFRAEYPFYCYQNNRLPLKNTGSWKNVIYVPADCPFSLFNELETLQKKYLDLAIKIALIGTKPHALGAIIYRLVYPERTEILYDHPIKKPKRTKGFFKKHVYDVSSFIKDLDLPIFSENPTKLR